jgi:sugar O-acyltransferase (sialic acid O-acetyltransferase NeuD family)
MRNEKSKRPVRAVIIGGAGDGSVVAEALLHAKAFGRDVDIIGFLNDEFAPGLQIYGFPILGRLDDWRTLEGDVVFAWALQRVGAMPTRVRRNRELGIPENRWTSVRHPNSVVASSAEIGLGSFIASFATVQPMARIGRFASLRAGASIGHHAVVKDHAYVGSNATMCGYSVLGEGSTLGPNAVLLERTTIGSYAVVGIGAAVTKNVEPGSIVMGNPARPVRATRFGVETVRNST